MYNQITLVGNLGRDAELKEFEGDKCVATFSVATNESYKDKKGEWQTLTTWHNVACWNQLARNIVDKFKKGQQVLIVGKQTYRDYEDKDKVKRTFAEVIADKARLLGSSGSDRTVPQHTAEDSPQSEPTDDLPF